MLAYLLALTLSVASPAGANAPVAQPALTVPYLAQTEALCGGAAVAMVFRYWGERHAGVSQFAPLVDPRAGGIPTTTLANRVRDLGWTVVSGRSTLTELQTAVRAAHPVVLLLEDRPGRYHFVVAIAADDDQVVVHDPAIGPSRRYSTAALMARWQAAGFWALTITPGARRLALETDVLPLESVPASAATPRVSGGDPCEARVHHVLDRLEAIGLEAAAVALSAISDDCPDSAAPPRELAAVRFGQQRWREAASLAGFAVGRDSSDPYTWNLLGASRFLLNDEIGALEAWNRVERPRLDLVQISGVRRSRYSLLTDYLGLTPGQTLSARNYQLAARRLEDWPDRTGSRLELRPDDDGYAVAAATLIERPLAPGTAMAWGGLAARTAVDREIAITLPGADGQGQLWRGSWRWWQERPRIALDFLAPGSGGLRGVWHARLFWGREAYRDENGGLLRQEQVHGGIGFRKWIGPHTRLDTGAGMDVWNGEQRTAYVGVALEQRWRRDRLTLGGAITTSGGWRNAPVFHTASVNAAARSSIEASGTVAIAAASADWVSRDTPLALWSGAGEGQARPRLLRAHPLLEHGIIETSVFGRRLVTVNAEIQRWLDATRVLPIAAALFVDAAAADRGLTVLPPQVDAGVGLRVRLPGTSGTLRVDYGIGVRDGARALTVGWMLP